MNILEIFNNLGPQNIEGLINLLSTLFGNSNNTQPALPPTQPNASESPPETKYDANSSYWSLPNYQFDIAQNNNSAQNNVNSRNETHHNLSQTTFANTSNQARYNNQQPAYINSTMQQNSMHNTLHITANSSKNGNIFEILKVLLPLLTKSTQNSTSAANTEQPQTEQKESAILSLKKTNEK